MQACERSRKVSYTTIILILLVFCSLSTIQAQEDVIRVNTDLVRVPATVLDREGRYITNLKKEDFQVFEDGVEQEVALFEPLEQPATVLFLLDVSSSMTSHKQNLAIAINALASRLRPNDQIMVASFFQWTDILLEPTKISDLSKGINFKIKNESDCPSTYLYNAVDDALERMKKIRGRKAIVLFTDGEGSGFGITAKDNYQKAQEHEALIYTFKFGTYPASSRYLSDKIYTELIEGYKGYLRNLSQITGGRNFQIEEISDLAGTFGGVADELGRQYSLGYYPKLPTTEQQIRQIKIKVREPNVAVRARNSYIAGTSKKAK
jgi:VWFA-related protein